MFTTCLMQFDPILSENKLFAYFLHPQVLYNFDQFIGHTSQPILADNANKILQCTNTTFHTTTSFHTHRASPPILLKSPQNFFVVGFSTVSHYWNVLRESKKLAAAGEFV